jgi:hypothetical protein
MRAISVLGGVVTMTNVSSVYGRCSTLEDHTDAMGWPSPGAITHCLVLPFGSSSPPFFEPCQVIDFDRANGKYFR